MDSSAIVWRKFNAPFGVQARVDLLAGRANEGLLTDEEKAEYLSLIDEADVASLNELKAQRNLKAHPGT